MLFRLAAATGMRRGELLGLRRSDVHLDTGRIEVTQALTAVGYKASFSRLKTKTSRRCITLDADTVEHPRRLARPADRGAQGRRASPTSSPWCSAAATAECSTGIPPHKPSLAPIPSSPSTPIRLHDLRHTHASLLLRDRVPIKVVSERLGHSTPASTMVTYQHVLPGMQDDAARTFATILAGHDDGRDR